jgi:hypothetical protein
MALVEGGGAEAVLLLLAIQGAVWLRDPVDGLVCWFRDDRPPAGSRMARSRR